jgi:DNA-binding MarR family transcriptional regulator
VGAREASSERRADRPANRDATRLLLYRVWRAENSLSRVLEEALRPAGLSVAQCAVLFHLDLHGSLSAADLSRLIQVTPQGIASTVGHLVARGWIDRRPHPIHGRVVLLTLNTQGDEALRAALTIVEEVETLATRGISDADRRALVRTLDQIEARINPTRA